MVPIDITHINNARHHKTTNVVIENLGKTEELSKHTKHAFNIVDYSDQEETNLNFQRKTKI